MVHMIPDTIRDNAPPGEKELFEKLSRKTQNTANWQVLHSVKQASHPTKREGEMDFIVIVPNQGILCLEIKSSRRIAVHNGTWDYGSYTSHESPFDQIKSTWEKVNEDVKKELGHKFPRVFYGVIFTHSDRTSDHRSDEWFDWQLITTKEFNDTRVDVLITDLIEKTFNNHTTEKNVRYSPPPTVAECVKIAGFLRPNYVWEEPVLSKLNRASQHIKALDDKQKAFLDSLKKNPRMIIEGSAGTGKTILAIEDAIRSSNDGKSVVLACYNRMLASWMRQQVQSIDNLKISTIHGLFTEISGCKVPDNPPPMFWEKTLPELAITALDNDSEFKKYDKIVIDEAQDILSNQYLEVLNKLVKEGIRGGQWSLFGDFNNQAIYSNNDPLATLQGFLEGDQVFTFMLNQNYRNTNKIIDKVQQISPVWDEFNAVRNHILEDPKIYFYENMEDQRSNLKDLLAKLSVDGISNSDIVILSPKSNRDSCASEIPELKPYDFFDLGNIRYCSIHSFKGLESPVIIITDVDNIEEEYDQKILYVGQTRAQHQLYLFLERSSTEIVYLSRSQLE